MVLQKRMSILAEEREGKGILGCRGRDMEARKAQAITGRKKKKGEVVGLSRLDNSLED